MMKISRCIQYHLQIWSDMDGRVMLIKTFFKILFSRKIQNIMCYKLLIYSVYKSLGKFDFGLQNHNISTWNQFCSLISTIRTNLWLLFHCCVINSNCHFDIMIRLINYNCRTTSVSVLQPQCLKISGRSVR